MIELLIGSMLITTACISKAISDKIQFHYDTSVFKNYSDYWNPSKSWKYKWKHGDKSKGERFPLSSTVLVSLTDAMHLFNSIYGLCLFAGAALMGFKIWWLTISIYVLGKIIFEVLFRYALDNGKISLSL